MWAALATLLLCLWACPYGNRGLTFSKQAGALREAHSRIYRARSAPVISVSTVEESEGSEVEEASARVSEERGARVDSQHSVVFPAHTRSIDAATGRARARAAAAKQASGRKRRAANEQGRGKQPASGGGRNRQCKPRRRRQIASSDSGSDSGSDSDGGDDSSGGGAGATIPAVVSGLSEQGQSQWKW